MTVRHLDNLITDGKLSKADIAIFRVIWEPLAPYWDQPVASVTDEELTIANDRKGWKQGTGARDIAALYRQKLTGDSAITITIWSEGHEVYNKTYRKWPGALEDLTEWLDALSGA